MPCGQITHETGEEALAVGMRLADGELHREDGAVLAQALDLAADADDPPLAGGTVAGEIAVVALPVGGRHQHAHVAADDLLGTVAEQPHRRRAERADQAALIDGDDRLRHGLQSRAQPFLSLLALGDVAIGLEHQEPAVGLAKNFLTALHHHPSTVPGEVDQLAYPVTLPCQRRLEQGCALRMARPEQLVAHLPQRFLGPMAVKTHGPRIPVHDGAAQLPDEDCLLREVEQPRLSLGHDLGPLALREIDDHADEAGCPALLALAVEVNARPREQPALGPARHHDPELGLIVAARRGVPGMGDGSLHGRHVVRVHPRPAGLVRDLLARHEAQQLAEAVVAGQGAGRGVEIPEAQLARLQRQATQLLAPLQAFLGALALGDVLHDGDRAQRLAVRVAQNDGAHQAPDRPAILADVALLVLELVDLTAGQAIVARLVLLAIVRIGHVPGGHAQELLLGIAEQLTIGAVDAQKATGERFHFGLGRLSGLEDGPVLGLASLQLALLPLPFRDVAGDLGSTDDGTGPVSDRRDRQRYVDKAAVLASPCRLVMVDPLASADALEDGRHLRLVTGRRQDEDVPALDLRSSIAEQALGRPVPAGDDALESLADDGVIGVLDDRSQKHCGVLCSKQARQGSLLHR